MRTRIDVKFCGGVANGINLTGSCTLITIRRGKREIRILVDIGFIHANVAQSFQVNSVIAEEIDFSKIDFIILTHSHIDHTGRLPYGCIKGFHGRVLCTEPTAEITRIMLLDTASILEQEARYLARRERKESEKNAHSGNHGSKNRGRNEFGGKNSKKEVLYTKEDAERSLEFIKNGGLDYDRWHKIWNEIAVKFYPSGHVLGGAICVLKIPMNCRGKKYIYLGFSGDLGRRDGIILPPPVVPKEKMDFWFTESTYGGISHPDRQIEINRIFEIIREAVKEKKKIIIPSFALERTQELIYLLSGAIAKGQIPKIDIYLDSPMAKKITEVFKGYWNTPMFSDQEELSRFNPFDLKKNPHFQVMESNVGSARLSKSSGPYIVIAANGMCTAGRVRNYLRENLPDPNTIVCLVGYMTQGSLGKQLQEGFPIVSMNKEDIPVNARIEVFNSFSGHADGPYLCDFATSVISQKENSERTIFLIHGEALNAAFLKSNLMKAFGETREGEIIIPELNETRQLV